MSKDIDLDDLELAGLSAAQLEELSEYIDPDNELLPASERMPPHTKKKASGPFDRQHLLHHLKKQAETSTIGEDYVPFVKKQPPKETQPKHQSAPKREAKSEFDDMLDMLDEEDLTELAAELGVHNILDQAQSRGDIKPVANPGTGLRRGGQYSYTPSMSQRFEEEVDEADIEETIERLESDDVSLRELNLNNHTQVDSNVIDDIIRALHGNTHLEKLLMTNVKFSEDHAAALAEVLKVNTSLRVLNLESNRVTRKGIKAIMRALAENSNTALKELRLANQYFAGGAGAEGEIAKYLEKNKTLVKLGYNFQVPSFRTKVDGYIMRNTDIARKKRASLTV